MDFFSFQKEAHSSQDEVVYCTFFSTFSLLNQALVAVSYSNTGCRGPASSENFELCQSSWCAEEFHTDCKSKVVVLATFGFHYRRTQVA